MHKIFLISPFLLVLFIGATTYKPKNTLSKEKMVEILFQLEMLKSIISADSGQDNILTDYDMEFIYKKNGTSKAIFYENYKYYLQNNLPDMITIYGQVIDRLQVVISINKADATVS